MYSPDSPSTTSSASSSIPLSSNDHYDIYIPPESDSRRIIQLRLSEDVVKQLQDQPDDVELSFDFNPSLGKYFLVMNDESHELLPKPAAAFSECYRQTSDASKLDYIGSVTHHLMIKRGLDDKKRQEIKQKHLLAEDIKHARKIELMTDEDVDNATKKSKKQKSKLLHHISSDKSPALLPSANGRARSSTPLPRSMTPNNASLPPQSMKRDEALRKRMIELLAVQPFKLDELVKRLNAAESKISADLISLADPKHGAYELKHTAYKEVDPYQCHWYDHPTRKAVIQRAKAAFTALGIPDHTAEWRRLSPPTQHPPQPSLMRIQEEDAGNISSPGVQSDGNSSSNGRKREATPDSSSEQRKPKRAKVAPLISSKKKEVGNKNKNILKGEIKNHSFGSECASPDSKGGRTPSVNGVRSSTPSIASSVPARKSKLSNLVDSSDNSSNSLQKVDVRTLEQPKPLPQLENSSNEQLKLLFESTYNAHENLYSEMCNVAQVAQKMHEKLVAAGIIQPHAGKESEVEQLSPSSSATPPSTAHSDLAREIDVAMSECSIEGVRVTFDQERLKELLSAAAGKYEKLRAQVETIKVEMERRDLGS